VSLELIAQSGGDRHSGVIDVGGGASTLVDHLLDSGYTSLAVLDVSPRAMSDAQARLGGRAAEVQWIESDVTTFVPSRRFGVWHDRAVFHFLTEPGDRQKYVAALRQTVLPGGAAIIATFAPDGPTRCSGLEVVRYDEALMSRELGPGFVMQAVRRGAHRTPWGAEQQFLYFLLRWTPG
jgi:trans-aconitate methyltransferase